MKTVQETMRMTTKRFALAVALASIIFLASGSLQRVRAGSGFDNSSLNGTYGFAFCGQFTKGNHPFCIGGSWNFHGDGTFNGSDTVNLDGSVTPRTYAGTYSINPDGSGSAEYTTSNGTNHSRNLEIVNQGNTVEFVQTEVDVLSAGSLIKQ